MGGANYIRHNTLKIYIEITNQTFPYDSKVQNNIKRHSNSSFIHHSVSGTKRTDISKTQTKLVFVVLFLPPLVKYIMYTCAWLIHAYFYTRLKYTHGKWAWNEGKVGYLPLPEGCWNLGRQDCANQGRGDHGLYTPKQQALLVRTHPSFCFNAAPSFQQAFLTIPVITLVYFHKGLG